MVRGCTTQCTAPPTLVALLVSQHHYLDYVFDASMLRITYMCLCAASPATYLSFNFITADTFQRFSRQETTKVPSMLRLLSYNAPLYTSMRLRTLARELYRESTPRRFPSLSRTSSSSCWTKATVSVTVLPYLLLFGGIPHPCFRVAHRTPVPKWSGLVSFLVLLNKVVYFAAQKSRKEQERNGLREHFVYGHESPCSSIDSRGNVCSANAASVSYIGRGNTPREP
ncbi:hypothetical protein QBC45DRAFT_454134 [Copromyces sp. CBS 386.78]|nr:hypothetical protein QBC45DRAFT_454134 [Copromyces sp. CBS 386.78]